MSSPATDTTPAVIGMYQGEDWSRELMFYADVDQAVPLEFTGPVMDIRDGTSRYVTFDSAGSREGTATALGEGRLRLTLGHRQTPLIPAGTYDVDIFADVEGRRVPITKLGTIRILVSPRSTQDPG